MGAPDDEEVIRVRPRGNKSVDNKPPRVAKRIPGRKAKSEKKARPSKGDMMVQALVPPGNDEDEPLILLGPGPKRVDKFFPGTQAKSLDLLEIVTEILQTYQDGGGDVHEDVQAIAAFLRVPATVPKKAKQFLPTKGKNLLFEDRAHLTAAALLLLLSWVQRKRHQILSILMDYNAEADKKGTKMKRLQQALEEFLVGPESLRDNSKKSGGA